MARLSKKPQSQESLVAVYGKLLEFLEVSGYETSQLSLDQATQLKVELIDLIDKIELRETKDTIAFGKQLKENLAP
jgi:hypothetical protein